MKYKRGQVSKILNIPIDTLRFYEQKNIINPKKDEISNYRLYDAWDINFLLDYKKYRSYDFSISEIEEIMHKGSLKHFINKIDERQKFFEKMMKFYTMLCKKNKEYSQKLKEIENDLDKCILTEQPQKYYFTHRKNNNFEFLSTFEDIAIPWMEYFPFVDFLILLPKEAVVDRKNKNDYRWGFSINKEYIETFELPVNDIVKEINHKKCVYTIICIRNKNEFSLKLLNNAMEYIENKNLKLCGDITGNLLCRVHEPEGFFRYIELWIPVE